MSNTPDAQTLMDMLKNREQIAATLKNDFTVSQQNMAAFQKLCELHAKGEEVSVDKVMQASAKSLKHLNEVVMRMSLILLTYTSGSNFTSDLALAMVKVGRGEDALREMFKQKMNGG